MKIQKLEIFNINKNNKNQDSSLKQRQRINLSFKGGADKFVKNADNVYEIAIKGLKSKLQNLIDESKVKRSYTGISEELDSIHQRNIKMADISEKFQIINEALTKSSWKEVAKDAKVIAGFIETMNKIGKRKGFNRISGYEDIKRILENEFILKTMMMARTSQKIDVPNALMFYGPTNNGKSTFAHALAEQTLSKIEIVNAAKIPEQSAMKKIFDLAKKAKIDYVNSGDKKQRTIIVVDEAEFLASSDSEVLSSFQKLIKNCADEYKCTLFLTTNSPKDFNKSILDKSLTPIKIGVGPADRKTAKLIVDDMLKKAGKKIEDCTDKFVNLFFKKNDKHYSNGDITQIMKDSLSEFGNPTSRDLIKALERNYVTPSISKRSLNAFYEFQAKYPLDLK